MFILGDIRIAHCVVYIRLDTDAHTWTCWHGETNLVHTFHAAVLAYALTSWPFWGSDAILVMSVARQSLKSVIISLSAAWLVHAKAVLAMLSRVITCVCIDISVLTVVSRDVRCGLAFPSALSMLAQDVPGWMPCFLIHMRDAPCSG